MRQLDEIFTKGDKTHTQLAKSEYAYLYEVTDAEQNEDSQTYFEVFHKRIGRAKTFPNGKKVPKRVIYPSTSNFGNWAWCISRGNDHSTARRIATNRFNFINEQKGIKQSA